MVSYLKIEIFSYDLFHTVWLKSGLISRKYDAAQIYKYECLSGNDFNEACDKLFYDAVLCRRILFQRIFMEEITNGKDKFWDSLSDFYEYIKSTFNSYDWFICLTVFEKIFATCAFVLNLCFYNRENENIDIIKFGHICWATYFEAFAEEFYEQGGWNQLKVVANSYTLPLKFLKMFCNDTVNALAKVTIAIENYNDFKQSLAINDCETISKPWIKCHINNLPRSSINPVEFADYEYCLYTEYILNKFTRLCDPCSFEVLEYDEECSERTIFDSDSFYIPLTPVESEESTDGTNSFLASYHSIGEDALPDSHSVKSFLEFGTDNSDFTNQSCFGEREEMSSNNCCDDVSNGLDILEHSIEFESIRILSDRERDQNLSKSMSKMNLSLNLGTLKLEKPTISEIDFSINTKDGHSVKDYQAPNTTYKNLAPQETMDKQYEILEESLDAAELVLHDVSTKGLTAVKDPPNSIKCFKESEFVNFSNRGVLSHDSQTSISDWNEEDLMKNISTPIKKENLENLNCSNRLVYNIS